MKAVGLAVRPFNVPLERGLKKLSDYALLTKLNLSSMVVLAAVAGFWMGSQGAPNYALLVRFAVATFLVAAGANAFNQVLERDRDILMRRTSHRPLPSGRMDAGQAFFAAGWMAALGLLALTFTVNGLTGLLAALALANYLFAYTPLKPKSRWCTFVGAVSGAIPPVMGWTAARNDLGLPALILFAILFLWQFPHFWAIAWVYRDDYARGGFLMLPSADPTGRETGGKILASSLALFFASLAPTIVGLTGRAYLLGALFLGVTLLGCGLQFRAKCSPGTAHRLLWAAMLYLPALLILMGLDKTAR